MALSLSSQRSDELYRGSSETANPNDVSTTFRQYAVEFSYRPLSSLNFGLVVPYVDISRRETGAADLDRDGLGDVALFADWSPWADLKRDPDSEQLFSLRGLSFLAGLELPTGEDDSSPAPGVVAPSLLQLGSGTFDPIIGVRYAGVRNQWLVFQQTIAVLPIGDSSAGLKPGPSLEFTTGGGYEFFDRVTPTVSFDALFRGRDELKGTSIGNTGGTLLFATPGISVRVLTGLYIKGTARIPVYRDLNQTQVSPGIRWRAGVSWSF